MIASGRRASRCRPPRYVTAAKVGVNISRQISLIVLEVEWDMKFKTTEDFFVFEPMTDDILKVVMLVKDKPCGRRPSTRDQI